MVFAGCGALSYNSNTSLLKSKEIIQVTDFGKGVIGADHLYCSHKEFFWLLGQDSNLRPID